MVHWLSTRNHSEFLAVPQLVRFTVAQGVDGLEATLLIKTSSLALKYLLRFQRLRVVLMRLERGCLAYGVEIADDPKHPALLWSVLENEDELSALRALTADPKCVIFLFNEAVINVAWAEIAIDLSPDMTRAMIKGSRLAKAGDGTSALAVQKHFSEMGEERKPSMHRLFLDLPDIPKWHPIDSTYVTNRFTQSHLSISQRDEGGQQEEIALWFIDGLHWKGAVKNPQIQESRNARELSDLLFSHEYGPFLIESKTLSILSRDTLPSRSKLTQSLIKHLNKATKQLIGGAKNIKRGYVVTDLSGNEIEVNRSHPPHLIILVPDLSLLSEAPDYGAAFFAAAGKAFGGFFHILDPFELLRMVQAAEMIAKNSIKITTTMAFDYYLIQRAKISASCKTPHFEMLFRNSD